jgi:iron complex transport system substrate-binding protein
MSGKPIVALVAAGLVCAGLIGIGMSVGTADHDVSASPDAAGRDLAVSPSPQRIVSMAPNITETVFALGGGDRLVGVTSFCVYPPEATRLPKVGGFYNPNLERLIALQPDMVLLQGRHKKVAAFCQDRHIAVLHVDMDSLATIYRGVMKVGRVLGDSARADALCTEIRSGLQGLRQMAGDREEKRVYISLSRTMGSMSNLYTVGGSSFVSQVLGVVGGRNVFADVTRPYPEVSKESLIKRAPDVILEIRPGERLSDVQKSHIIEAWNAFPTLPAVCNEQIYILTEDFLLVPGPRVVLAARRFADAIHGHRHDG